MSPARPQQRYDHRLRDLVRRTGDLSIATALGVPRSTARGWLGTPPRVVISAEVADLTPQDLRQEIVRLRQRVEKLAALLRLTLAVLHASGFRCPGARVADGDGKQRILRAVDQARRCMPLRAVLRFLGLSPGRFQPWRRRQHACALEDTLSCPRTSPHRLTRLEVQAIRDMVHLARVLPRANRHPCQARAEARHSIGVGVHVVRSPAEVRLAPPAPPPASGKAEGGTAHVDA